ncbi:MULTISPECIES: hypothetical protein [Rickettsia]|uniref:Uncharacterized protein n=1 Tax=Rickettsia bellii str. RML An4 TaxID=1359193 RepID=A0A0F3QAQ1_RICBE|nr:hypothetical protein [Rickettsia bellii]ABV79397.1 hypothetical protein A1I_05350 [Rickettsia bellii OSU 85-389]KJV89322.1 hypothetical protein RBEAN4_0294 [Rickettsia bellii str. RML An4]HJD67132.1 hypothetical protein [Rickettsia endosymbiont of Bembidion lapponicum]
MNLYTLMIKIGNFFSLFIPEQNIEKSSNDIPANREATRDYYEDLGNPY